jgi:hypothetical protein
MEIVQGWLENLTPRRCAGIALISAHREFPLLRFRAIRHTFTTRQKKGKSKQSLFPASALKAHYTATN